MSKRRRPWKVFVHDIGPAFSFASESAARARVQHLVDVERYGSISLYDADSWTCDTFERSKFVDGVEYRERLIDGLWTRIERVATAS